MPAAQEIVHMNEEKLQSKRHGEGEIAAALDEAAACLTSKQVEKIASYCDLNGLKKVFADAELMRTAECFIGSSLNISAAARALYMHRNTMMYRLDKIKRFTGLDVRLFYDAVAFRVLYRVYARGNGVN